MAHSKRKTIITKRKSGHKNDHFSPQNLLLNAQKSEWCFSFVGSLTIIDGVFSNHNE